MKQEIRLLFLHGLKKWCANKWLGDKTGQGFFKKIKIPVTKGSPEKENQTRRSRCLT